MTGEQYELLFMVFGCGFGTLVGYGAIELGPETAKLHRVRRMLRQVGPLGTALAIALFVISWFE